MRDRELLEMAAKAYWGDEIDDVVWLRWSDEDQSIAFTHGDNQDHNGNDRELLWNPLIDDGDAFRLAVKLKMFLDLDGCNAANSDDQLTVWFGGGDDEHAGVSHDECDPYAATRLAIVRAAAEIGKAMP